MLAALHPENHERAYDECNRHRDRMEKMRFDQAAEREPEHRGRDECDH